MKKKFLLGMLSIATAACMAFGLAGCGENKDTDKNDDLWTIERASCERSLPNRV